MNLDELKLAAQRHGLKLVKKQNTVKEAAQKLREEAKSLGYEVSVRHTRKMRGFAAIVDKKRDTFLSRGEFDKAVDEMSYECVAHGIEPTYGRFVDARGGFTVVSLKNGERAVTAKYNFGNDPFCRYKGVVAALGKALKAVKE